MGDKEGWGARVRADLASGNGSMQICLHSLWRGIDDAGPLGGLVGTGDKERVHARMRACVRAMMCRSAFE